MRQRRQQRKKKMRAQLVTGLLVLFVLGLIVIGLWTYAQSNENEAKSDADEAQAVTEDPEKETTKNEVDESSDDDVLLQLDQPPLTGEELEQKVESIIEQMTLKEKIGQMIVVGFNSPEIDQYITTMISDYHVGGVILFDRNMESPAQVASLNKQLQKLALKKEHQIPLYISIDQEGGDIIRMREKVSPIPSQQELGERNDPEEVLEVAKRTGEELSEMGFTVNHAPVLDLSDRDSRSFGEDPEKANLLGRQVIAGMANSGITATVKHFPGNGRSEVDPHIEQSSVEADKLDLENQDIYPFKQIIQELDHHQFFVMVTHLKYPAYDKENPASISPVIIQDLLRDQLGYTGIVVTDDLEMGAVNKYFTYEDLGYRAVGAGADLLLVCHTYENQQQVYNGILKAVKSGKLSEERIDESVKRILMHKFGT